MEQMQYLLTTLLAKISVKMPMQLWNIYCFHIPLTDESLLIPNAVKTT